MGLGGISIWQLAIVLLMTLVSCGIPNWGLMRFLAPTPVAPFHLGASDERFWNTFAGMNLPAWLFPVESVEKGRTDPTATWFYTRVPRGESIPWAAWIIPLLAWGAFAAAMLATLVAIGRLIIGQWMTNERLPMPLVRVQAALIESPEPGRRLTRPLAIIHRRSHQLGLTASRFLDLLTCEATAPSADGAVAAR